MKKLILILMSVLSVQFFCQHKISGHVLDDSSSNPMQGALVEVENEQITTRTNANGGFVLNTNSNKIIVKVTSPGYDPKEIEINLPLKDKLIIYLHPKTTDIELITLNTGYQKIAKERSTGSFSKVGSSLLEKQVATNLMEKLPNMLNGVLLDNATSETPQLMVRGLSTMQGPKNPLIILDDFPYEGNISNINPNMIESVTVLKDASAASIWGARAANGVIVITTKRASGKNVMKIDFSASTGFSAKPDLSYLPQISSKDFIDVEKALFSKGYYNSDINAPYHPVITPVVSILDKQKNGLISSAEAEAMLNKLSTQDVRSEYQKYMYQYANNNQYALNLSGNEQKWSYAAGVGFDDNTGNLAQKYNRFNFRLQNSWKPLDKLTLSAGVLYNTIRERSGKKGYGAINVSGNWQIPYIQFANDAGNPISMYAGLNQDYKDSFSNTNLLDWNFYPLTDWKNAVTKSTSNEWIINSGLNYKVSNGLNADIKYQYQKTFGNVNTLYNEESYYARNYINNFAQIGNNGAITFIIPKGGILDNLDAVTSVQNIRGQLNFDKSWNRHSVSAIAGGEARSTKINYVQDRYYGYDEVSKSSVPVNFLQQFPVLPSDSNDYILNNQSMREKNNNFVSIYSNAAYTFNSKYTLSGSARKDASNLFGLNTNDQWNPFWSTGFSWKVSNENFYNFKWLPLLKIRGSYGFNGNIDPSMVAVTTIIYDASPSIYTGTGTARIDQYYNPNLRWETSRIVNIAADFSSKNNKITGSVEFYTKKGSNLFGTAPLDYTTGITTLLWNVAGMKGNGLDVELKTENLKAKDFGWTSVFNFSTYRDKVTNYYQQNTFASNYIGINGVSPPISGIVGLPVHSIFAYKWAGLDPLTGEAQGYLNGEVSKDYAAITGSEKGINELQYFGSAIPTSWGSIINSLNYRNLSLDVGLTYKVGYWFRRNSINYTNLMINRTGHSDFALRWQKPGDENNTVVPSFDYTANSARDMLYNGSSVLVEKGDHVRLQFITLAYTFKDEQIKKAFNNLQFFGSVNNIGIIWRANKHKIDPDSYYGLSALKPSAFYNLGFRVKF